MNVSPRQWFSRNVDRLRSPRWLTRRVDRLRYHLTRGRAHRRRLDELDLRIAVTGTRGKSTLVRWLHEALVDRDYDTYSKTTGQQAMSYYNDVAAEIDRDDSVTLYENEREIKKYDPEDAIVVENHGIREYTTRLVNMRYVDPHIVVLTNVRLDHLDTLGRDYRSITQSLVRSIPSDTHVISGERNEAIVNYLTAELDRRDCQFTSAVPAGRDPGSPGSELLYLLKTVLEMIDDTPLSESERKRFRSRLEVSWDQLPNGRIYFAADVNDVDSTEQIRQALQGKNPDPLRPLVYFRRDRPGRTASYVDYLNHLADRELVAGIHTVGDHNSAVTRKFDAPVITHDVETESPEEVLDVVLDAGDPVIVMGNSVPEFVQELESTIQWRASLDTEEERSVQRNVADSIEADE